MNIGIVGGDLRIVELIKLLHQKDHNILICGLEGSEELNNYIKNISLDKNTKEKCVKIVDNLDEIAKKAETIITSIPISKDGIKINTPFSHKNILVQEMFNKLANKKIITGNITQEIASYINAENKNNVVDILNLEELKILNAIPTAEGAIQVALEESQITIHNNNCLVMGFGRIGKILSKMLYGLGANVYCEARKPKDLAEIFSNSYKAIDLEELNENLSKFDFIFNTIPCIILNEKNLGLVKQNCVLIDLASKPGGIDFKVAQKLGLKAKWALALPGKVAPKTAATYIYKTLGL